MKKVILLLFVLLASYSSFVFANDDLGFSEIKSDDVFTDDECLIIDMKTDACLYENYFFKGEFNNPIVVKTTSKKFYYYKRLISNAIDKRLAKYKTTDEKMDYLSKVSKKVEIAVPKVYNKIKINKKYKGLLLVIYIINDVVDEKSSYIVDKEMDDYLNESSDTDRHTQISVVPDSQEKLEISDSELNNIKKYLSNKHNYTRFDNAVLSFQRKYLVKTIDLLFELYNQNLRKEAYSINGNLKIKADDKEINIQFIRVFVEVLDNIAYLKGNLIFKNKDITINSILELIFKDDILNKELYVKFDKLNVKGFNNSFIKQAKQNLGKYIKFGTIDRSQNDIIKKFLSDFKANTENIRNILNTQPLVRELEYGKYRGKHIVVPTYALSQILSLINGEKIDYDDMLKNAIISDTLLYTITKDGYKLYAKNDIKNYFEISYNGEIRNWIFDDKYVKIDKAGNIDAYLIENDAEKLTIKGNIDNECIVKYERKKTYYQNAIKLVFNIDFSQKTFNLTINGDRGIFAAKGDYKNGINLDFKLGANIFSSKGYIRYNKTTGFTDVNINIVGTVLKGSGVLKKGKNNFTMTVNDSEGKQLMYLFVKDRYIGYNAYNEKIKLEINDDKKLLIDGDLDIAIKSVYKIAIPKNYIKIGGNPFASDTMEANARDVKRKSDLSLLSTALMQYFNDEGEYPYYISTTSLGIYLVSIPKDPKTNQAYYYKAINSNGSENAGYVLAAQMENSRNCNIGATNIAELEKILKTQNYETYNIRKLLKQGDYKKGCYYVKLGY